MNNLKIPSLNIDEPIENIYLSSDEHLGHKNIIRYAGRKYSSIPEMDEDIIVRHNAKVPEQKSVWICLGDFAFVKGGRGLTLTEQLREYVRRFNGSKKIIIMGNHDRQRQKQYYEAGFDIVVTKGTNVECRLNNFDFVMRHCPYSIKEMQEMRKRNNSHGLHAEIELECEGDEKRFLFDITNEHSLSYDLYPIKGNVICGHVHQLYRRYAKGNVVNVGVDVWDMSPVKLLDAVQLLDK